jgi:SAM-dependent methyltransferase
MSQAASPASQTFPFPERRAGLRFPRFVNEVVGTLRKPNRWKNWLIYHLHDRELLRVARAHFRGRLADVGCGTKPYAGMVKSLVREHVGIDHAASFHDASNVDLFGTAYAIPAADASFDCAMCTAVLEHLEEPEQAVRECRRVLKPGGVAVYTVPFIWHLHEEPRDFYRFTRYGLTHVFTKAGFEVLELKALSGFFTTFGTLLGYYLCRLNRGLVRRTRVVPAVVVSIQLAAMLLDRLSRDERYTWMYLMVARKPAADAANPAASPA